MAENSKIEWCDHTFNPWEGCTKVSPGCANCYAEARNHRFGGGNWGKGAPRRRTSAANWKLPLRWNREAARFGYYCSECGIGYSNPDALGTPWTCCQGECRGPLEQRRPRVFCASLADWLDDEVPIEWLADLLKLIHDTPNLDWLLLTKRPENWEQRIAEASELLHIEGNIASLWLEGDAPNNVWIGTSVEDQTRADERIPALLKIPARVRFLSVEPMIGPIDFTRIKTGISCEECGEETTWDLTSDSEYCSCCVEGPEAVILPKLHWSIFGGESGPNARPCHVEWIRDGIRQCRAAGLSVFVKQLGARACQDLSSVIPESDITDPEEDPGSIAAWEYHRQNAPMHLKDPKGGDMAEWPEQLRVRQFPRR